MRSDFSLKNTKANARKYVIYYVGFRDAQGNPLKKNGPCMTPTRRMALDTNIRESLVYCILLLHTVYCIPPAASYKPSDNPPDRNY